MLQSMFYACQYYLHNSTCMPAYSVFFMYWQRIILMCLPVYPVLPVCFKSWSVPVWKHLVCQYIIFLSCTGKGKIWFASTIYSDLYWHTVWIFHDGCRFDFSGCTKVPCWVFRLYQGAVLTFRTVPRCRFDFWGCTKVPCWLLGLYQGAVLSFQALPRCRFDF